jgi:hypothetical protein
MYRNIQRLSAMVLALFNVGLTAATTEQVKAAESQIKRENVAAGGRGVGPWFSRSPGWRQSQRRKLARRRGK